MEQADANDNPMKTIITDFLVLSLVLAAFWLALVIL
jgi:hypothetical protein